MLLVKLEEQEEQEQRLVLEQMEVQDHKVQVVLLLEQLEMEMLV